MALFPEIIIDLMEQVKSLPGIGEKSALKMSLHLCKQDGQSIKDFISTLKNIDKLKQCNDCLVFCDGHLCNICEDSNRNSAEICVVENYLDFVSIEKGGAYKGKYHILNGVLNPLLGIGPNEINIKQLIKRIQLNNITDVILALNPSVEGDATCSYIKEIIPKSVEVSRIGFGIPLGSNLEYIDSLTIIRALENKKKI